MTAHLQDSAAVLATRDLQDPLATAPSAEPVLSDAPSHSTGMARSQSVVGAPSNRAVWSASLRDSRPHWLAAVLAGVGTLLIAGLQLHAQQPLEINSDEGITVMKAWMVAHGHPLYTAVWDDQPPISTIILRWVMGCCGWIMGVARGCTLFTSALLVGFSYDLIRMRWGHRAACACSVLLLGAPFVLCLAVAAMIGLPCLALVVLSLWALARWARAPHPGWVLASAIALAIALGIKGFSATFLLAAIASWVLLILTPRQLGMTRQAACRHTLLWIGGVSAATAAILVLGVPRAGLAQLIQPHVAIESAPQAAFSVPGYLFRSWPITVAALVGAAVQLRRREWIGGIILVWWLLALLVILLHRPLWWHHTLLATIPGVLLAGGGMAYLLAGSPEDGMRSWMRIALGIALVTWSAVAMLHPPALQRPSWRARDDRVLEWLRAHPGDGGTLVSDRCIYPFLTGRSMPDDLVVATWARIQAHDLDAATIIRDIATYKPATVIMTDRWQPQVIRAVAEAISPDYSLIFNQGRPAPLKLFEHRARATSGQGCP